MSEKEGVIRDKGGDREEEKLKLSKQNSKEKVDLEEKRGLKEGTKEEKEKEDH